MTRSIYTHPCALPFSSTTWKFCLGCSNQQPGLDIQKPCCVGKPLVLACQEASAEIVKLLLENGAHDSTAIIKAKNMQIIDCLLQHGADINTADSEGSTLLHSACNSYDDQVDMVTKLLELGANANARKNNGDTPLYCVAFSSQVNIATLLLERGGADVDAVSNSRGNTPRLRSHDPPMLALLLERGANVNARNKEGSTKLHEIGNYMESSPGAALANVTLVVQAGIDLNAKNKGETALFTAIHNDKRDLVNRLLQEGADPNAVDNKGWTTLHVASHCERTHLVDPLLEAGVNINAASNNGTTALHLAVWRDFDGKTVKRLLEHGADANATTQNGSTPLGAAIGRGHLEVRRWLRCCWNTVPM
jgi:ankyrin repeat protein